jgi:hypothetical protein
VVFCGILEIRWFLPSGIIIDSANEMAAINDSHLNIVIFGFEQ